MKSGGVDKEVTAAARRLTNLKLHVAAATLRDSHHMFERVCFTTYGPLQKGKGVSYVLFHLPTLSPGIKESVKLADSASTGNKAAAARLLENSAV